MTRPARLLVPILVAVLVADLVVLARREAAPEPAPEPASGPRPPSGVPVALPDPAGAAARRFLDRYVAADGRVVRHDEGGDTVSEGQAYALLVALVADDRRTFDAVWAWTETRLRRPDGLLAWHWADGEVVDDQPAADADLDAAWALALAADRWDDAGYRHEAGRLAAAVEARETAVLPDGREILVPGPWAVPPGPDDAEVVVNPSYSSPVGEAVLVEAGLVAPARSTARTDAMRSVLDQLIDGSGVPSDWVARAPDGTARGIAGPRGGPPGRFGWDAVRVPLRYAGSCDEEDRALAARTWAAIEAGAGTGTMGDHPARLVAAASAAAAAGHRDRAIGLLARADAAAPTYYGRALTALGWALLTTDRLGGCPPLG